MYSADVILKVSFNFVSSVNVRVNINTILSYFFVVLTKIYDGLSSL